MDELVDILNETKPVTPLICPRCGERVELCISGHIVCWGCGELIYDPKKRFWRIRLFEGQ